MELSQGGRREIELAVYHGKGHSEEMSFKQTRRGEKGNVHRQRKQRVSNCLNGGRDGIRSTWLVEMQ